jgi:hypothetical protein
MLPSRTSAGFQLLKEIPSALLAGEGVLAKGVHALAAKLNVKLDIRVRAESFSLLVSAIENPDDLKWCTHQELNLEPSDP